MIFFINKLTVTENHAQVAALLSLCVENNISKVPYKVQKIMFVNIFIILRSIWYIEHLPQFYI